MRVFLTGGTGYVGSVVAERLLGAGHEVTALARSDRAVSAVTARGMSPLRGDVADGSLLRAATADADAVVHTAAPSGDDLLAGVPAAAATIGTLLDAAAASRVRLILTGGVGLYGDTGEATLDESSPLSPAPPLAPLVAAESRAVAAGREGQVTTIRPAIVHGRGASHPVLRLVAGVRRRGRAAVVSPASAVSAVHVDDLADLYLAVLAAAPPSAAYIAATETVDAEPLMRAAAVAAGVAGSSQTAELDRIDAGEALAAFEFVGGYLAGAMRVTSARARAELGWAPWRPSIVDDLERGSYSTPATPSPSTEPAF